MFNAKHDDTRFYETQHLDERMLYFLGEKKKLRSRLCLLLVPDPVIRILRIRAEISFESN